MSSPVSYDLQGQGGGIVLGAGDSASGKFRWIQVITDAVIDDLGSGNIANNDKLEDISISAGVGIGGMFTSINLTSGVVIAYYA
jgi:hypothetical protein